MPTKIKGHVNYNNDGSYTIFINAKMSYEQQKQTYIHELKHIMRNDFERDYVDEIERSGHGL